MKYMIIAGEASGDLHASRLIESLKKFDDDATFIFLGGDLMRSASNTEPIVHIKDMAFMGFSEVLRNLGKVRSNLDAAKKAVTQHKPDALILVDYPSFNLKVASAARKIDIPVFYYISPKVWAWKEHRVKAIKKLVDRMFVIFPFEVEYYYNRHDYQVTFVGNPSVDEVDRALSEIPTRDEFLAKHKLRDRPLIALLPGSRLGEIRNNLRIMTAVAERYPQYRAVIAGAPNIGEDVYRQYTSLPVVYDETLTLLAFSRAALVTSGTATLEAALVGTPQVACYRSNGRKLAYDIMKKILKVPFVTLPNLIADKEIIPEMLVHLCTVDGVFEKLTPLLRDTRDRILMLDGYRKVRDILKSPGCAPDNTAKGIIEAIRSSERQ